MLADISAAMRRGDVGAILAIMAAFEAGCPF
jgi:hypothetical protein